MSLVTMTPLLKDALKRKYAIGGFNVFNIETIRGAVKAAEDLNSPLILQLAEVHLPDSPIEYLAPVMVEAAKRASVPVAVHYDHGQSFESVALAIKLGFSSVMFDGARLPYEENVYITKEIVKLAHSMGVTAEAELGHVGDAAKDNATDVEAHLTVVDEAARFVKETGVDALAVSIGNLHGEYRGVPMLRLDRLREISSTVNIPLVLHGGTGISDDDFKKSVLEGMTKINISTSMMLYSAKAVKDTCSAEKPSYFSIMNAAINGAYETARHHMMVFGSSGKASGIETL